MRGKLILVTSFALVLAILAQCISSLAPTTAPAGISLRSTLDVPVEGWAVRDLPLGTTELLEGRTADMLRFDEYFFRTYRRGATEFSLYVAYWSRGKHPPQMIANHTPDVCWRVAGMTCEESRFNVEKKIADRSLWPGQWRKFRDPQGIIVYTVFWHLVGNRPIVGEEWTYDPRHPWAWWRNGVSRLRGGGGPTQLFVRMTSNVPPEDLWDEPGFQAAAAGFVQLGLVRPPHGA